MMYQFWLPFFLSACHVAAVNLYVASYSGGTWAGNVTTLSLSQKPDSTYSLTQTTSLNTSTNSPSWLTFNRQNNVLYLIDEAVNSTTNGTIVAYQTSYTGELTEISRTVALVGGVHGVFYASGHALAVPHYTGSTLQTYDIKLDGSLSLLETFNFSSPDFVSGTIADRQEAPHPHETILDPTGQYLLVPDLGADQVHIFNINQKTKKLSPQEPLKTSPGYGPRHGAFSLDKIAGSYVFYLVGELSGNVTAYRVDYGHDGNDLKFHEIASYGTLNPGESFPKNPDGSSKVAPAEIEITPDGSMLIVSNRNDTTFGTKPPTDSLVSFSISLTNGSLKKLPLVSAHGSFPRQFALNRAGNLLAVGLQNSGNLVVLRKNLSSGLFDEEVASIEFSNGINIPVCIVWDE